MVIIKRNFENSITHFCAILLFQPYASSFPARYINGIKSSLGVRLLFFRQPCYYSTLWLYKLQLWQRYAPLPSSSRKQIPTRLSVIYP